jgi:hypothetical protein
MYQARFEIPNDEVMTFVNANLNLLSSCDVYSKKYADSVSFTFSSNDEFHVTTLDEIYHYTQDDIRRREMSLAEPALPF